MVFTGRPSAGCATCKRRKKKCDLTKPFCTQCLSTGKQCPGVPDEFDTLLRMTTTSTAHISSSTTLRTKTDSPNSTSKVERPIAVCRPQVISTDWSVTAVTIYFNQMCSGNVLSQQVNPWFELQTRFYATTKPDTALNYAVTALAAMYMAIDLHVLEFSNKANIAYGKALRAVNASLANPLEAKRDDIAIGVFAMISFELKQQERNFHTRYEAHIEGMKNLLLLRGREQLQDPRSLKVFRALRSQVIYDHILRRKPLTYPNEQSIWTESFGDRDPIDGLCAIAARLPSIVAKAQHPIRSKPEERLSDLVLDAITVKTLLDEWYRKWKGSLVYDILRLSDSDLNLWDGQVYIFVNFSAATLMNSYQFLRTQCLETLFKFLTNDVDDDSQMALMKIGVEHEMQDSINDICYTTPFISGQFTSAGQPVHPNQSQKPTYPSYGEATWILLPIVVASLQPGITQTQRHWLKRQLLNLNADFGLFDASALPYDILKIDRSSSLKSPLSSREGF